MTATTTRPRTLRTGAALAEAGLISPDQIDTMDAVAGTYAVAVPDAIARLIDPSDPADPIARQVVPDARELESREGELSDPIGDQAFSPIKGITHRYPDRLLLKPVLTCPLYCRFCFRREVVGTENGTLTEEELELAFRYIEDRPEIWEVIVTGGDPLVLSDRRLRDIIRRIDAIPHVRVIRIHTRIPIADPARVGRGLIDALKVEKGVFIVLHCNHPRELSDEARVACDALIDSGFPVLSQTVLLRGVNDDADTLELLMRALVRNRIKPYYLHHPDRAPGTSHFWLPIAEGQAIVRALRGRVSGLCQPTYVLDIPGGHGKVPVGPGYLAENQRIVLDYQSGHHPV